MAKVDLDSRLLLAEYSMLQDQASGHELMGEGSVLLPQAAFLDL